MKSHVHTLLARNPPDWHQARDILKSTVLSATLLDPLDGDWLHLADIISSKIPDRDDRLLYWTDLDKFIRVDLHNAFPGVPIPRGHTLFRRALLELRRKKRLDEGKKLLRAAVRQDKIFGRIGMASAAAMWLSVINDLNERYLNKLLISQRGYFLEALEYAWDSQILRSGSVDARVPGCFGKIARKVYSRGRADRFKNLAQSRQKELFVSAGNNLILPALACTAYLAEWCGIALLLFHGVTDVKKNKNQKKPAPTVPVEDTYLDNLVHEITSRKLSQELIVGSLLWFVRELRNRIHAGNDLKRKLEITGSLAGFFPPLVDRLVIETAGAIGVVCRA